MSEAKEFEEWFIAEYKRPYNFQDPDDNDVYLLWTVEQEKEVTA